MPGPPHGIAAGLRRLTLAALAVGLVAAGPRSGAGKRDDTRPKQALQLFRRGLLGPASVAANGFLVRHPTSADGLAVAGAIDARRGWGPEAADLLDAGAHGVWYRRAGLAFHALALSEAARYDDAVAMRRAALASHGGDQDWPDQAAALVDDLRAQGDALAADDALHAALAQWPGAGVVHAVAADLAIDRGDLDAAHAWLWLSERDGDTLFRLRLVRARLARVEGDPEHARDIVRRLIRRRPKDPTARALQVHLLCDAGDAPSAVGMLSRKRFDGLGHPVLQAALGRAWWLAGFPEEARAASAFLSARVPDHPDVRALAALVAGPLPADAPR